MLPAVTVIPSPAIQGVSIYRDICDNFSFIHGQLEVYSGSFYFTERRRIYYERINQILVRASPYYYSPQPVVIPHEVQLRSPLSELESEMIGEVHNYIHLCAVNVMSPFLVDL